jgi:hypothetical protein
MLKPLTPRDIIHSRLGLMRSKFKAMYSSVAKPLPRLVLSCGHPVTVERAAQPQQSRAPRLVRYFFKPRASVPRRRLRLGHSREPSVQKTNNCIDGSGTGVVSGTSEPNVRLSNKY